MLFLVNTIFFRAKKFYGPSSCVCSLSDIDKRFKQNEWLSALRPCCYPVKQQNMRHCLLSLCLYARLLISATMNVNLFPDCTERHLWYKLSNLPFKNNTIHILRCFKEIYNSINLSLVYGKINFNLVLSIFYIYLIWTLVNNNTFEP